MGELNQHDLSCFGCNVFIETGTGKAVGTSYACTFPQFRELHTIEIMPQLHEYSKSTINDPRLTFHLGNSVDTIKAILPKLDKNDRVLFWLDAHFPGADYQLAPYKYDAESMPLNIELQTICGERDTRNDTFIIDDLRLYEEGSYELGSATLPLKKSGIGFIEELLGKSHSIKRDYRHQGFLILTPKIV